MNRESARRAVLWLNLVTQIGGGVLGFTLAPAAVFAAIDADALARMCLRLAAWSHLSMAALTLFVLLRREVTATRVLAGAATLYHGPAAVEAWLALGSSDIRLAEPTAGPLVFHAVLVGLLLLAALAPSRRDS